MCRHKPGFWVQIMKGFGVWGERFRIFGFSFRVFRLLEKNIGRPPSMLKTLCRTLSRFCTRPLNTALCYIPCPRDPSIKKKKPTLGPKVCKYYLHWAIWIPRVCNKVCNGCGPAPCHNAIILASTHMMSYSIAHYNYGLGCRAQGNI